MITAGLALASITCFGFWLVYQKLPGRIKKFMAHHSLLTDIVACVLTYILFGGTLVALFASAFMGIIVSIMLAIANNEIASALMDVLVDKVVEAKNALIDYVKAFAENHIEVSSIQQLINK